MGRWPDVDFGLPMTLGLHDHRAADGIGTVFCWAPKKEDSGCHGGQGVGVRSGPSACGNA